MGRKTMLTDEVRGAIRALVREGVPLGVAARKEGVGKTTAFDWLRRGAAEDSGPFREFHDAIEAARGEYAEECQGAIRAHMRAGEKDSWRAAAWYLERMEPEYRDKVEVGGLSDAELLDVLRGIQEKHGGGA